MSPAVEGKIAVTAPIRTADVRVWIRMANSILDGTQTEDRRAAAGMELAVNKLQCRVMDLRMPLELKPAGRHWGCIVDFNGIKSDHVDWPALDDGERSAHMRCRGVPRVCDARCDRNDG